MTHKPGGFQQADEYLKLESEMKRQVERDNRYFGIRSTYIPCIRPERTVDYIFVAMEPRIEQRVPLQTFEELCRKGFVNFIGDMYCATVHYSIWRALGINSLSEYHITDISKGAMSAPLAAKERTERYRRWEPLLKKEIELLSNNGTQIVAFGAKAGRAVKEVTGREPLTLLHYSRRCDFRNRIKKNSQWEREYASLDKEKLKKEIVDFNKRELLLVLPPAVTKLEDEKGLNLIISEPGNQSFEPLFMRYFVYQKELQHLK